MATPKTAKNVSIHLPSSRSVGEGGTAGSGLDDRGELIDEPE